MNPMSLPLQFSTLVCEGSPARTEISSGLFSDKPCRELNRGTYPGGATNFRALALASSGGALANPENTASMRE
jgi:hypothetical protein